MAETAEGRRILLPYLMMSCPCVTNTVVSLGKLAAQSHSAKRGLIRAVGRVRNIQNDTTGKVVVDRKVLTFSSLIQQDGITIQELPIIVKRASQTFSPFSKILSCADSIKKLSEQDENFKLNLQNCMNVKQVFKLLEVPSDQVTGYSAAFALQRISQLRETSVVWDGDGIDNFIRTAVMNELYDTVIRDVAVLENDTLINLVKCYLISGNFNEQCVSTINMEVENRLGDSSFSIDELCSLSNTLSRHCKGDLDIVNKIWANVGMRTGDLTENNITNVYRSLPLTQKHLVKILDRKLLKFWWKLTGEDISLIVPCLVQLKSENRSVLSAVGKWTFLNIHTVTDSQLTNLTAGFVKFNFHDANLLKALERYIPAKGFRLDTNLLALVVEYLRGQRYLSPCIMDAAASHFEINYKDYKPLQTYSILRTFGFLNYLPRNCGSLFLRIEEYIDEKFQHFTIPHITELLCSFTFVGRYPVNFVERIFSASFLSRAHELNDDQIRSRTEKWIEMIQSAVRLEAKRKVPNIYKLDTPSKHCWMDERHHMLHNQVLHTLEKIVGEELVIRARLSQRSAYFIDFVLCSYSDGTLMNKALASSQDHLYPHKYAILLQMPEAYCVNAGHLLGEYAMRNRHLKLLNYQVIEFPYKDIAKLSENERQRYILSKLPKYLKLKMVV